MGEQFLIVERDAQLVGNPAADLPAAAAELPADGDHGFLVHVASSLLV